MKSEVSGDQKRRCQDVELAVALVHQASARLTAAPEQFAAALRIFANGDPVVYSLWETKADQLLGASDWQTQIGSFPDCLVGSLLEMCLSEQAFLRANREANLIVRGETSGLFLGLERLHRQDMHQYHHRQRKPRCPKFWLTPEGQRTNQPPLPMDDRNIMLYNGVTGFRRELLFDGSLTVKRLFGAIRLDSKDCGLASLGHGRVLRVTYGSLILAPEHDSLTLFALGIQPGGLFTYVCSKQRVPGVSIFGQAS